MNVNISEVNYEMDDPLNNIHNHNFNSTPHNTHNHNFNSTQKRGTVSVVDENGFFHIIKCKTSLFNNSEGSVFIDDSIFYVGDVSSFVSHPSESKVIISNNSGDLFIYNFTGKLLYKITGNQVSNFKYYKNDIIGTVTPNKIIIYKNTRVIFTHNIPPTKSILNIDLVNDYFALTGHSNEILFVDVGNNCKMNSLIVSQGENISEIQFVTKYENYEILIGTEGDIYKMDIRDVNSVEKYPISISTLFDYCCINNYVGVGGKEGFDVIRLEKHLE